MLKRHLTLLGLVVLCALPVVSCNLIGFDFGSNFMKATLVKAGKPFSIIENTASKRKTETMVTIGAENRLFGADSFLESSKYPQTTFAQLHRLFGVPFDSDKVATLKKDRFLFNEFVADERGLVAWKITRPANGDEDPKEEQILFSEEVVAMLFGYVKMLAEIQAETTVRDCVITIPSWFTYDQRLMIKDAAELANLKVLQLVHENTAAATMFAIDNKIEADKSKVVMFYNMGSMDTEVQIARYSLLNTTAKKSSPYIEILSETSDPELGADDLQDSLVRILAEKFDNLPERKGKQPVLGDTRAVIRLKKEAVKIMEILSANKFANIKVPELLDYVTLQFNLEREEFEQANKAFFARVVVPANKALEKAGLTMDDIDELELLGGGVRVPMVTETLQAALGKEASVHLNGDEAMCFGAAFIASNSSADFKVKQIFLTQHPQHDVTVRISPLNPEEATSREDQLAEGIEEGDLIKYEQEFKLFNGSDYVGKSKALNINYNRDMKIELLKHEGD